MKKSSCNIIIYTFAAQLLTPILNPEYESWKKQGRNTDLCTAL